MRSLSSFIPAMVAELTLPSAERYRKLLAIYFKFNKLKNRLVTTFNFSQDVFYKNFSIFLNFRGRFLFTNLACTLAAIFKST